MPKKAAHEDKYKRVNVLIRPEQWELVHGKGLSLSGLVRDLIDDRFGDTTIVLTVRRKTKKLYDHIISNFGSSDAELEHLIVEALDKFLVERGDQIEDLRHKLQAELTKK